MTSALVRVEKAIVFVVVMAALLALAIAVTSHTEAPEVAPSAFSSAENVS